jgi:hypothetical protein
MASNRRIGGFLAALLILAGWLPVSAKTLALDTVKCQLTIPDDWKGGAQSQLPGSTSFSAVMKNAALTESVSLFVTHLDSSTPLGDDSSYIQGFLKSCADNRASVVSRDHRTVNGIDFYVLTLVQKLSASLEIDTTIWLTAKDGRIYQLAFWLKNGDPDKNSDFSSIINSFSFAAN